MEEVQYVKWFSEKVTLQHGSSEKYAVASFACLKQWADNNL